MPPSRDAPHLIVRSWLALVVTSLLLIVGDVIERLVITPCVLLMPSSRTRILAAWIKIMAWICTRLFSFLGGSTIPRPDSIVPTRPGVLVLMNHQSLFDIPLVIQTVANGYPRIVARARYGRRYIPECPSQASGSFRNFHVLFWNGPRRFSVYFDLNYFQVESS